MRQAHFVKQLLRELIRDTQIRTFQVIAAHHPMATVIIHFPRGIGNRLNVLIVIRGQRGPMPAVSLVHVDHVLQ